MPWSISSLFKKNKDDSFDLKNKFGNSNSKQNVYKCESNGHLVEIQTTETQDKYSFLSCFFPSSYRSVEDKKRVFSISSGLDEFFKTLDDLPINDDNISNYIEFNSKEDKINADLQALKEELESCIKAIKNSANHHDVAWKESVYAYFQGRILQTCEYLSVNTDNINKILSYGLTESHSQECQAIAKNFKKFDKWLGNIVPLIVYLVKYRTTNDAQENLLQQQNYYQKLKNALPSAEALFQERKAFQRNIHYFHNKFERDRTNALNKFILKLIKIAIKLSSITIEKLGDISGKTANKVSKSFFSIIRDTWGIKEVRQANAWQKEWLYHLQNQRSIKIQSILEQEEAIASIEQEQENDLQNLDYTRLIEEIKELLASLENCETLVEVKEKFKQVGFSFEPPSTLQEFKEILKDTRYVRDLIKSYYYCKGEKKIFSKQEQIAVFLAKKQERQKLMIAKSNSLIKHHLQHCQNLPFAEIKDYFANQLHIYIDSIQLPREKKLPCPPTTEQEWQICLKNEEFIQALATQWVDFQESTAILMEQTLRQWLLSKHTVESKFLSFRALQYGIGFASTLAQLVFFQSKMQFSLISSTLEIFVTDLSKIFPSLGIFYVYYPLYPELNFNLESILMLIAEHFVGIKDKPHEYSLASYQLTLQIRMIELALLKQTIVLAIKQILLSLYIHLIENRLKKTDGQASTEDERYLQINHQYTQEYLNYKKRIQELRSQLDQFILKDTKQILSPQPKQEELKRAHLDPILSLVESLKDADIDFFPPSLLKFIEEHLGFDLDNSNKQRFRTHLENYFCTSENEFFKSYSKNRFVYLKV